MYTREIQAPQPSPIENGIPQQGTWTQAFDTVDLLDIPRPFSVPLPRWMRNWRIKEWESFIIQDDRYHLNVMVMNCKYYSLAQVFVYDEETKERAFHRKLLPLSGWHLPQSLANVSIESRAYGFFFRIHNWLDTNTIRVDLHSKAGRRSSSFTAHVTFNFTKPAFTPMAVNLLFSESRCMYVYKAPAVVRGTMDFNGRQISLHPKKTTGLFCDVKGFFPYRMHGTWCTGFGIIGLNDGENRRIGFSIGENQTKDTYKNNENALWVDGNLTPLPPVKITMPHGIESDWVIQDVEGMVDLTFSPQEQVRSAANCILTRGEYDTPIGYYNGMLVNSKGETILVKNCWGLGEKLYIRV